MNSSTQIVPADTVLQFLTQRTLADYFAIEIYSTFLQFCAGIDQDVEALECDQTSDAKKPNWGRRARIILRLGETAEVDSVVDAENFFAWFRATRRQQIAAVIGFGTDKLRAGAKFA